MDEMMKSKRGVVNKTINSFIGLILIILLAAALIPTALYALGNLSIIPNLPLASIFASTGIVALLIAVFVLLGVLKQLKIKGMK